MKMAEAMEIINNAPGFMVHFNRIEGNCLTGDHFPDGRAGEDLIETEEEAWDLANKFAASTKGKCVDIYVIRPNYTPVKDYKSRGIDNR